MLMLVCIKYNLIIIEDMKKVKFYLVMIRGEYCDIRQFFGILNSNRLIVCNFFYFFSYFVNFRQVDI